MYFPLLPDNHQRLCVDRIRLADFQELKPLVQRMFDEITGACCNNSYRHVTRYYAQARDGIPFTRNLGKMLEPDIASV